MLLQNRPRPFKPTKSMLQNPSRIKKYVLRAEFAQVASYTSPRPFLTSEKNTWSEGGGGGKNSYQRARGRIDSS
jgi:hypothetical protein